MPSFLQVFKPFSKEQRKFKRVIQRMTGERPRNVNLYQIAFSHASAVSSTTESNERLEYLGDAILGAIVADHLFKLYPYKDEGFLTEIRSKIVNRESLNGIGRKIGLGELVRFNANRNGPNSHKSLHGNALEALVGACYLDLGFKKCYAFVIGRLIVPHIDIEETIRSVTNFKSALIEWAQKEGKTISFNIIKEKGDNHNKEFTAQVFIDGEALGTGSGLSKKKAEQAAAKKSHEALKLS